MRKQLTLNVYLQNWCLKENKCSTKVPDKKQWLWYFIINTRNNEKSKKKTSIAQKIISRSPSNWTNTKNTINLICQNRWKPHTKSSYEDQRNSRKAMLRKQLAGYHTLIYWMLLDWKGSRSWRPWYEGNISIGPYWRYNSCWCK